MAAPVLRDHVWIIDTASPTAVTTDTTLIDGVRWVGATTAAHTVVLEGVTAGGTIWADYATQNNYTSESRVDFRAQGGFKVTTLGSGVLYVYGRLGIVG